MRTSNVRVESIRPLLPPAILIEEQPLSGEGAIKVNRAREDIRRILDGQDDRVIVIVGPCSVHDPVAAMEYAQRLKAAAGNLENELYIVMRTYFEKPRTTVGWKGLINDPHLDGSFAINEGLRIARRLLVDILELGLPVGCEYLDPISPQFTSDIVAWAAIGARTTESQVHRELASGLSMPVGFKNGTDGRLPIAIDAVRAANYPHSFLGVTEQGLAAIIQTQGNPDCHVILRGGEGAPNYDAGSVKETIAALQESGLPPRIMVDASHGNSNKDHKRQPSVVSDIASQVAQGQTSIMGVMMESFLVEGRQKLGEGSDLMYGQSITDACMSWDVTAEVLVELAEAVRSRRSARVV